MRLGKWEKRLLQALNQFEPLGLINLGISSGKIEIFVPKYEETECKEESIRYIDKCSFYRPSFSEYHKDLLEGSYKKMFNLEVVKSLIDKECLEYIGTGNCIYRHRNKKGKVINVEDLTTTYMVDSNYTHIKI